MKKLLELFRAAPEAFWRHDVDIDLFAAVKMARFAQVAGISSTFYLNPRSDFYNLFSWQGKVAIDAIRDAGHDIGLHCDYREGSVRARVLDDLALLSHPCGGLGLPFGSKVSFHMPSDEVLWRDFDFCDNAYASKWKGHYLADSRGRDLPRSPTNEDQINLHPEWWF